LLSGPEALAVLSQLAKHFKWSAESCAALVDGMADNGDSAGVAAMMQSCIAAAKRVRAQ